MRGGRGTALRELKDGKKNSLTGFTWIWLLLP